VELSNPALGSVAGSPEVLVFGDFLRCFLYSIFLASFKQLIAVLLFLLNLKELTYRLAQIR
jgi:hypothetical protein